MKRLTYKGLFLLLFIVVLIYIALNFFISFLKPDHFLVSNSDSINALFSGLAFAALIYTIMQQREDLDLQRKQIESSINAQNAATEEIKKQNQNIELQRFENTFFKVVDNQTRMYLSISYRRKDNVIEKSDLINYLNRSFTSGLDSVFIRANKEIEGGEINLVTFNQLVDNYHSFPSESIMYTMDMYLRTISSTFYFLIENEKVLGSRFIDFVIYFKLQFSDDIIKYIVLHQVFRREPKVKFDKMLSYFDLDSIFDPSENVSDKVVLYLFNESKHK
ncbi:MAG: hypothetical protein PF694_09245 [Bacteroidetes bacterium]|jgi:hypothetical protein|nr:hypothetical protein [Bacteroidota bacterium]